MHQAACLGAGSLCIWIRRESVVGVMGVRQVRFIHNRVLMDWQSYPAAGLDLQLPHSSFN